MKFLALEHELPDVTAAQFQLHLNAEAARVWELYQAGMLREIYFRQDRAEVVLVLECTHEAEAQAALATLPLVEAGLITFELISLRPYPGLARLFADNAKT